MLRIHDIAQRDLNGERINGLEGRNSRKLRLAIAAVYDLMIRTLCGIHPCTTVFDFVKALCMSAPEVQFVTPYRQFNLDRRMC